MGDVMTCPFGLCIALKFLHELALHRTSTFLGNLSVCEDNCHVVKESSCFSFYSEILLVGVYGHMSTYSLLSWRIFKSRREQEQFVDILWEGNVNYNMKRHEKFGTNLVLAFLSLPLSN